jgi:hypothetical protein
VCAGITVGCGDSFDPTPLPDLYKDPKDFAVAIPPDNRDGGAKDLSPPADLTGDHQTD